MNKESRFHGGGWNTRLPLISIFPLFIIASLRLVGPSSIALYLPSLISNYGNQIVLYCSYCELATQCCVAGAKLADSVVLPSHNLMDLGKLNSRIAGYSETLAIMKNYQ
jgi:hypothetical protein